MADVKKIIANNLTMLRISSKMTQAQLAKKLNYSDKAVSKWERGESIPDISALVRIADLYNVTLDYLVKDIHTEEEIKENKSSFHKISLFNHGFILGMSILLVLIIAGVCFIVLHNVLPYSKFVWLIFSYAIIAAIIVWLIFNSIWFDKRKNYLIISLLMWTVLFALHLTLYVAGLNLWMVYLLGIPGQIIIIFWSRLKY